MLLRSITQNLKDQNWFAVGLDFLIVFVGVFVGLQAQDWSDERELDRLEMEFLEELRYEIQVNVELTQVRKQLMALVVESGERSIAFLEADEPCVEDCWPILVDFFTASQVFFSPLAKTVYEEMLRLGLMRTSSVKQAIRDYYLLIDGSEASYDTTPAFRLRARELLSVPAQRALWAGCHRVSQGRESMVMDCPPGLPNADTRNLLDRFLKEPSLRESLNYWVGTHSVWLHLVDEGIETGENAIDVIDAVLADNA